MRHPSVLVVLACSLVAVPASGSNFWEQAEPSPAELQEESKTPKTFDELVDRAEEHTKVTEEYRRLWIQAIQSHQAPSRPKAFMEKARQAAKRAIRYYDKALELRPEQPDLHFRCGQLTDIYLYAYYENNGPASLRDRAGAHAVEHWDAFERLAPDDPRHTAFVREAYKSWDLVGWDAWAQDQYRPSPYQFSRSIYYTKLGGTEAFEKAIDDYDFLLDISPRNNRTALWIAQLLTNSAEIHMALGNLEDAIERYREGLEYSNEALYKFGLSVALDRAGDKESALETMRKALDTDPKMNALIKSNVFFIPKGDIHYYYGLAFEAEGKNTEALLHFRAYIDRIVDQRYIEHARDHIDRLDRTVEAKKKRK